MSISSELRASARPAGLGGCASSADLAPDARTETAFDYEYSAPGLVPAGANFRTCARRSFCCPLATAVSPTSKPATAEPARTCAAHRLSPTHPHARYGMNGPLDRLGESSPGPSNFQNEANRPIVFNIVVEDFNANRPEFAIPPRCIIY